MILAATPRAQAVGPLSPVHHFFGLTAGIFTAPGYRDGEFWDALFDQPTGLCVTPKGDKLFVADSRNHRIRVVDLEDRNRVSTLSGTGAIGSENGPLKAATWNLPTRMVMVGADRIAVYDPGSGQVRLLDLAKGTVSSLTGQKAGAHPEDNFPAEQLSLPGWAGLCYLPTLQALVISHPPSGSLWKVDLASGKAQKLLTQGAGPLQPMYLALHEGKLVVSDGETGTLFTAPLSPQVPFTFTAAGKVEDLAGMTSSGGVLYALHVKGVRVTRLLPDPGPLASYAVLGQDPYSEDLLGTGLPMGGPPGAIEADPTEAGRFFIADPGSQVIYNLADRHFAELKFNNQPNPTGLMDFDYPFKKPPHTKRILMVGNSHLYFTSNPGNLRWETTPKLLELHLATQASLRGSPTRYEVLTLAHATGEEYPYTLWPYYEVPKMVEKYDIDEVLYMAVPQVHSPFDGYFSRPMGPTGIPAGEIDPEYFLKPLSEKKLDPEAMKLWEKAKAKNFAHLGPQGQAIFSDLESLMAEQDLLDEIILLAGRPFGQLAKNVAKMRTSGGLPVGFHLCYIPVPLKNAEKFREFWRGIVRSGNIPWLDLFGPIRALRPTYGEITDGGHEHLYLQGHYFLAYLLSQELVSDGIITFEKGKGSAAR